MKKMPTTWLVFAFLPYSNVNNKQPKEPQNNFFGYLCHYPHFKNGSPFENIDFWQIWDEEFHKLKAIRVLEYGLDVSRNSEISNLIQNL